MGFGAAIAKEADFQPGSSLPIFGARRDETLTFSVKAAIVGFAEFLFLMRLCNAGAGFISARWERKDSRASNESLAGVFRRLEQAGSANIALLVSTTVALGPIVSGGENPITIIRSYAYHGGGVKSNGADIGHERAYRRLMEACHALAASTIFNAVFMSMRLNLLGRPLERIVTILERHARMILSELETSSVDEQSPPSKCGY